MSASLEQRAGSKEELGDDDDDDDDDNDEAACCEGWPMPGLGKRPSSVSFQPCFLAHRRTDRLKWPGDRTEECTDRTGE
jgi:hypothetical protein